MVDGEVVCEYPDEHPADVREPSEAYLEGYQDGLKDGESAGKRAKADTDDNATTTNRNDDGKVCVQVKISCYHGTGDLPTESDVKFLVPKEWTADLDANQRLVFLSMVLDGTGTQKEDWKSVDKEITATINAMPAPEAALLNKFRKRTLALDAMMRDGAVTAVANRKALEVERRPENGKKKEQSYIDHANMCRKIGLEETKQMTSDDLFAKFLIYKHKGKEYIGEEDDEDRKAEEGEDDDGYYHNLDTDIISTVFVPTEAKLLTEDRKPDLCVVLSYSYIQV